MKFLSAKRGEDASLPPDSRAPTVVPSENPSSVHIDNEKERVTSSGGSLPSTEEKVEVDKSLHAQDEPTATPQAEEPKEDEPEYPTGLPLLIIVVGLCLGVLLVALVSRERHKI